LLPTHEALRSTRKERNRAKLRAPNTFGYTSFSRAT
jgi:hypothetical protein